MKFRTANGLTLDIEERIVLELAEIGKKHYPNEFGGFLMGSYSTDFRTLHIIDYLLPKRFKGLPQSFERSTDGLVETFDRLFEERGIFYVGEWHTHPDAGTGYSPTDLNAMIESANCPTVNITNPVLLILGVSKSSLQDYRFYVYTNNTLTSYDKS